MTLQQLKYVLAVSEKKNISEAARTVYVSQPSLSAAIRELEKETGVIIFRRTNRGISVTPDGEQFLGYARQIVEQTALLEEKYLKGKPLKQHFSVSSQHYSFAVTAFVGVIRQFGNNEYEFSLRETRTHEIIEDVRTGRSEIGILYLNDFNEKVIVKLLRESGLTFSELFRTSAHVFISTSNPLAKKEKVTLEDLRPYPFLSFEQGTYNSFYFSEEILSSLHYDKMIKVTDRATLFNLLIGLDGYTISTGIINKELNGPNIIALPLAVNECIRVGSIRQNDMPLSKVGTAYMEALKEYSCEKIGNRS